MRDIHEYAEDIRRSFQFDHCSAFIQTKGNGPDSLLWITETEGCRAINEKYVASNMSRKDPFTNARCDRELNRGDDVFMLSTPESHQNTVNSRCFWNFMAENGLVEAGASRRRIATGTDIVIGLHRGRDLKQFEINPGALRSRLSTFHDLIARHLLGRALETGHGLATIRSMAIRPSAPSIKLSPQEMRIASLIKAGKRNKEIAYVLNITENTVEGHLRSAFRKMKVHNRTSLISALSRYY